VQAVATHELFGAVSAERGSEGPSASELLADAAAEPSRVGGVETATAMRNAICGPSRVASSHIAVYEHHVQASDQDRDMIHDGSIRRNVPPLRAPGTGLSRIRGARGQA